MYRLPHFFAEETIRRPWFLHVYCIIVLVNTWHSMCPQNRSRHAALSLTAKSFAVRPFISVNVVSALNSSKSSTIAHWLRLTHQCNIVCFDVGPLPNLTFTPMDCVDNKPRKVSTSPFGKMSQNRRFSRLMEGPLFFQLMCVQPLPYELKVLPGGGCSWL